MASNETHAVRVAGGAVGREIDLLEAEVDGMVKAVVLLEQRLVPALTNYAPAFESAGEVEPDDVVAPIADKVRELRRRLGVLVEHVAALANALDI